MATLNSIEIINADGTRPMKNINDGNTWLVEKGEPFNIVKFMLNEAYGYYFPITLCVSKQLKKDEIEKLVKEYVNGISDEQVKNFNSFLKFGEEYGWD